VVELDIHIFRFLHHALSGGWVWPMALLSAIGGGWGSLAVIPFLVAHRTRQFARSLVAVLAATAVLVFAIKRLVARARPCNCLTDIHARVFQAPTDFSFPSGHSAGSFAFAVFVAIVLVKATPLDATARTRFLRRLGAVMIVLLALAVGLSRISLGVHFPGDVLAGALLGTTVAAIGARLHFAGSRRPASA
jgi:undecaprenyl-diphosphatase